MQICAQGLGQVRVPAHRVARGRLAAAMVAALAGSPAALAGDALTILQWFETSWVNIENRAADVFMNGYSGMWVPSPSLASTGSAGFDPFDRFNLGTPESPTAFGTEQGFRAMIAELNRAGVRVYPETIMNHNGGRTSDANFIADGGYPGIYLPGNGPSANPPGMPYNNTPGAGPWINCGDFTTRAGNNYFWGDFHNGAFQSENPGGANYCLWLGDLVSLVDIAQESNYRFIRQPVGPDANNIPPGRTRNLPSASNARFYADTSQPAITFTNPAVPGFSSARTVTRHRYNLNDPTAGDPIVENVAEYLARWNQWMLEDIGVDGFRLDAAKHIKHDFWNEYFDSSINLAWQPLGAPTRRTPFTFGESVDSNANIRWYTRKQTVTDGNGNVVFQADRDALDLNEAGRLRDQINNPLGMDWQTILNNSVDTADDGFNNGTLGVHHVYSHDNGSNGGGGAPPGFPTIQSAGLAENAYVLLRSGVPVVYYYGREMISRYATQTGPNSFSATLGRFWPREGNPTAMGNPTWIPGTTISNGTFAGDSQFLTNMVRIRNGYSRGNFNVINGTDPVNGSLTDVLIFERTNNVQGNIVVGLNKRDDNGFDVRNVAVNYPVGTRLRELTGNAADATVDPTGEIPDVMVVTAGGRLADASNGTRQFLRIPRARNVNGVEHGRSFVMYGPAAPSGTLSVVVPGTTTPAASSTIPADTQTGTPPQFWRLRTTALPVITASQVEIRLDTVKTDPLDSDWDNQAVFRINKGYFDYNKNGQIDIPESSSIDGGYERFITGFSPISNTEDGNGNVIVPGTNSTGVYRQLIDVNDLVEGNNYISVICYRRRAVGTGLPIFTDFRTVVHVDRLPPQVDLNNPSGQITSTTYAAEVLATDNTTTTVWIMTNVPQGVDPRTAPATYLTSSTLAARYDRRSWRRNLSSLPAGTVKIDIVAQELSGQTTWKTYNLTNVVGNGDVNLDGATTLDDLYAHWAAGTTYIAQGDMNRDGSFNNTDRRLLELVLRPTEAARMRNTQR
jgi:glycosidase